ncbi:MAG: hypothetical protein Q8P40_16470, partial [Nitrospirota bacterium]|nr:hypothetical protein [Nitrospirota bacterium]
SRPDAEIRHRPSVTRKNCKPKNGFLVHERHERHEILKRYNKTVIHQTGYTMMLYILLFLFVLFVIFVDNCFFWVKRVCLCIIFQAWPVLAFPNYPVSTFP